MHDQHPVFDLPERLVAKADPVLIGADEQHFAAVRATLTRQQLELSGRLDEVRRRAGGRGRRASDRDLEIHRLSRRLQLLQRFGLDSCLGRVVYADGSETTYVGRWGLADGAGRQLLVDWRTPAAEPFFAATHADPRGLLSRRRFRWTQGRVTDYWDEVFAPDGLERQVALDDQSAFIATLASSRSTRMRDVLATIQADQDAIIRAGSRGALVVDGGPGTGKTVVALHRAAYLLYSDPRVSDRRGGVLFVGPHRPYLAYVADVLPNLGEEGVQICTIGDLVAEGVDAIEEPDREVALLKASARMVDAIEPAVTLYEEVPAGALAVDSPWGELTITPADWDEAFATPDPGTPHNVARDEIWQALLALMASQLDDPAVTRSDLEQALRDDEELADLLGRSWTLIEAADLVGDLWTVPAYLRRCAPWLRPEQVNRLQRTDPHAWTTADLPLLDAARRRLGDPDTTRRRRRRQALVAAEQEVRERASEAILDALDDADDDVIMLHGRDLQAALIDQAGLPDARRDRLAGPFAHVVVDEAQELTDAEWRMLLERCPSRSFTVVGDRAQARRGFRESWAERLQRVGFGDVRQACLTINYRTPQEVMVEAEPLIRAVLPDANVPVSIRSGGRAVTYGPRSALAATVRGWLLEHPDGMVCVVGEPSYPESARVRSLTPALCKGLEFDLVVLVDPDSLGAGTEGAVDRYVAMTRATQRLVILSD